MQRDGLPVRDAVRRFARARNVDPLTLRSSGIVMVVEAQDVRELLTVICARASSQRLTMATATPSHSG